MPLSVQSQDNRRTLTIPFYLMSAKESFPMNTACKAAVIHLHKGAVFLSPLLLHTVLPVHKFPCHLLQFHPNPKCADFLTIPQPAEAAHTFL